MSCEVKQTGPQNIKGLRLQDDDVERPMDLFSLKDGARTLDATPVL